MIPFTSNQHQWPAPPNRLRVSQRRERRALAGGERARAAVRLFPLALLSLIVVLMLAGCNSATRSASLVTAPTAPATLPTESLHLEQADLVRGQQVWLDKQCINCHGETAQGGIGPTLAGLTMPFEQFLQIQRTAIPPKPSFNAAELPSQDAYNVYSWLQSLDTQMGEIQPLPTPNLAEGQVLGMSLWTQYGCDQCHGAFAQGSLTAPTLAGMTYPYELERANMRLTENEIPQHKAEHIRDDVLKRLYKWLQAGANPGDGC